MDAKTDSPAPRRAHARSAFDIPNLVCFLLAAIAASFAAYFAHVQADMAVRTGERQLRAYMNVVVEEVPSEKNDAKALFIDLALKNFGLTPAFHVKLSTWIDPERRAEGEIPGLLRPHPATFHLGNNQSLFDLFDCLRVGLRWRRRCGQTRIGRRTGTGAAATRAT